MTNNIITKVELFEARGRGRRPSLVAITNTKIVWNVHNAVNWSGDAAALIHKTFGIIPSDWSLDCIPIDNLRDSVDSGDLELSRVASVDADGLHLAVGNNRLSASGRRVLGLLQCLPSTPAGDVAP